MGKIIKVTESDIRNMVLKILLEQNEMESDDNPLATIQPSKMAPRMRIQNMSGDMPQAGNQEILQKKIAVRMGLKDLVFKITDLISSSGINPETNNLVADIEKVQDKFENLWGDPTPDNEEGDE